MADLVHHIRERSARLEHQTDVRPPLITTDLVLTETGWLLDRELGPAAEAALYRSVADGELVVEQLSAADWKRIAELT